MQKAFLHSVAQSRQHCMLLDAREIPFVKILLQLSLPTRYALGKITSVRCGQFLVTKPE